MFVAKFQQVNSAKFNTDKNGNFPYIGEIIAGKATGSIINGTMFQREGLEPNRAYLCQNITEEYDGKDQVRTAVISAVSLLELKPLMDQLGNASLDVNANSPE
tara:strand:+ start:26354 stop:26662 length:309 start_codon:yes stop_codon:yes gene_type:complete